MHEAVAEDEAAAEAGGGPAVAAISTADVQHMVDSLPGESSAFLPDKWLVDSRADVNICFNYEWFSYIGPSDVDICTPIGSTPVEGLWDNEDEPHTFS